MRTEFDDQEPPVSTIERMTITMPADMAAVIKAAVDAGDYASTSEVVRDALREWKMKRAIQLQEIAALKTDIDKGLADVAAGRMKDFDTKKIVERGRKLLATPLILRLTDTAEADLAEIWAYLAAEASEEIATRFVTAIEAKICPASAFTLARVAARAVWLRRCA